MDDKQLAQAWKEAARRFRRRWREAERNYHEVRRELEAARASRASVLGEVADVINRLQQDAGPPWELTAPVQRGPASLAHVYIAAYIRDRAEQYDQGSGYVAALYKLAAQVRDGEAKEAYEAGELDDILRDWR